MRMKKLFRSSPSLALIVGMLLLGTLSGCCDGTVNISGKVYHAISGAPLGSVRLSMYVNEKKEINSYSTELTDSTGNFLIWDFGYCNNTKFFILVTKPGFVSQTLTSEFYEELDIRMVPD
jgi:hypothetical protein